MLAGGSAAFAAAGPVLGGLLTAVDWRLVFVINVPLALVAIALTLRSVPALAPSRAGSIRNLDFPGVAALAISATSLLFGLSQLQQGSFSDPLTFVPLLVGLTGFAIFALIELRVSDPLLDLRLFRHLNFLASNISQVIAGMIELGLGYLLPFLLLLVIGVSPEVAGIALIPATIPIIAAGPLAGRVFDRIGGRIPLAVGFAVLAGSGAALAIGAGDRTAVALIPGLILQGIGLGIVLTVNDPVGLNAVDEGDRGTAAGMINTSEQLGGALGIAILLTVELSVYKHKLFAELADRGIHPTATQSDRVQDFILRAEQSGFSHAHESKLVHSVATDIINTHVTGFQMAFVVSGALALIGCVAAALLVRREDRVALGPVFGRRSRWIYTNVGSSPGLSRRPPPKGAADS